MRMKRTRFIRRVECDSDEVLDEGYDPKYSPLGCPVYWRIVRRDGETLYCSTFCATRDRVISAWGVNGLAHCDPITGMAIAQVETLLEYP